MVSQRRKARKARGPRQRACNQCDKVFLTPSGLSKHRGLHHGAPTYPCTLCAKPFMVRQDLESHVNSVHLKLRPYACAACGKASGHPRFLVRHSCNVPMVKAFQCALCPKGFHSRYQLDQHAHTHSELGQFRCKDCRKTFKHSSSLSRHIKSRCYGQLE